MSIPYSAGFVRLILQTGNSDSCPYQFSDPRRFHVSAKVRLKALCFKALF